MDGNDFLDVADEWSTGSREAEWRSAISRAYYAAFHRARRLLCQCGFVVPGGERAHGYLWLRLSNSGHPDMRQAGLDLTYLRRARNEADYDLDRPLLQSEALDNVALATDIIHLLQTASAEPTVLAQITDAMKRYERDILREVTWHP